MAAIDRKRPPERLPARQERALAALLANPTHEGAAKAAGISPRTLRRYLRDEKFCAEYERRTASLITEASARLMRSTGAAIDALLRVAQDANGPPYAQVSAARALLDANLRYAESKTLQGAARQADVPVFYYDPAEAGRIPNEAPTIFLGVEPQRATYQEAQDEIDRLLFGEDDSEGSDDVV